MRHRCGRGRLHARADGTRVRAGEDGIRRGGQPYDISRWWMMVVRIVGPLPSSRSSSPCLAPSTGNHRQTIYARVHVSKPVGYRALAALVALDCWHHSVSDLLVLLGMLAGADHAACDAVAAALTGSRELRERLLEGLWTPAWVNAIVR